MSLFQGENREQMRRRYLHAWRRFSAKEQLEPLEAQLAAVIAEHPEYIQWLQTGEAALSAEFTPAGGRENPFLHMGLHLALREQLTTDRPAGIALLHRQLSARTGSVHAAEHQMIEVLAEALWEAQRNGQPPDEEAYAERLRRL